MSSASAAQEIQRRSRRLRQFVTAVSVALAGLLLLERFSDVFLQMLMHGFDSAHLRRIAGQGVLAIPEVFYLLALWGVRQALAAFARGELYAPTIGIMLNRVGTTLATGCFISVMLVPAAMRVLGRDPGYWIAFDISAWVLGVLGLSLKIIARVLRHASGIQAELDGIF